MVLKRFINILKANINSGASLSDKSYNEQSFSDEKEEKQTLNTPPLNAIEKKEAEYFANLEVSPGANFPKIKASYRELMKKYHPDKFKNEELKKEAELITSKLNEAYSYFEKKFSQIP